MPLAQILSHARGAGLDGVCITDHDTMQARHHVREGVQPDGLLVIIGMEYATPQGDFLLFGPFEDLAPGLAAPDMLALVHEAGGAAIVAHPCRAKRPADATVAAKCPITAVERLNGRNTPEENALALQWEAPRHNRSLTGVAGSDAHTLPELGQAPTLFFRPVRNRDDLILSLRRGLCTPFHHTCRPSLPLCTLPLTLDTLPMAPLNAPFRSGSFGSGSLGCGRHRPKQHCPIEAATDPAGM